MLHTNEVKDIGQRIAARLQESDLDPICHLVIVTDINQNAALDDKAVSLYFSLYNNQATYSPEHVEVKGTSLESVIEEYVRRLQFTKSQRK